MRVQVLYTYVTGNVDGNMSIRVDGNIGRRVDVDAYVPVCVWD